MATLAERIAARKLVEPTTVTQTVETLGGPPIVITKSISPSAIVAEAEDALVKKEPVIDTSKPMTFAEKMALKKSQAAAQDTVSVSVVTPVAPVSTQVAAPTIVSKTVLPAVVQEKVQASILSVLKDAIEADDLEREEYIAAPDEVKQGYRDIKGRVLALSATEDDDLALAMTELKKALLQNPNACLLMLDEDIGKMTLALRRLTQEALVEGTKAKAEKKPGVKSKKTAQIPLSAEDMQKVFDEL